MGNTFPGQCLAHCWEKYHVLFSISCIKPLVLFSYFEKAVLCTQMAIELLQIIGVNRFIKVDFTFM